jgi:tetratricopeptide (TPR) repeat protein
MVRRSVRIAFCLLGLFAATASAEPARPILGSAGDVGGSLADADLSSLKGPALMSPAKAPAKGKAEKAADAQPRSDLAAARLLEHRGQDPQAEKIYRDLQSKNPRDPQPYHRLGVIAVRKNEFAQAEKLLHMAASLAPPTADLLSDLGYCYYLEQRLPEAEETLNEALKIESNHAAAINNLALCVGAQGRFDEAMRLFQRVNKEGQAYANLAYVLAQHGDLAASQRLYERALTLDSSLREAAKAAVQVAKRKQMADRLAAQQQSDLQTPPANAAAANRRGGRSTAMVEFVDLDPPVR